MKRHHFKSCRGQEEWHKANALMGEELRAMLDRTTEARGLRGEGVQTMISLVQPNRLDCEHTITKESIVNW